MSRDNGSVLGVDNTPTADAASGIWSLNAVARAVKNATWPNNDPTLALDFDETTTLDSRITFTRATDGTYFDSSGVLQTASSGAARFDHRLESGVWVNKGLLIEEQRTNVCLQSEDLSTTWTNTNTTETTNAEDAPDGNTTADAVLETVATGDHVIYQAITANMTTTAYTGSVFVKANGRTKGNIHVLFATSPFPNFIATFDLTAGTIEAPTGGGTPLASAIEDVGDGWFRVSVTGYTGSSGTHRLQIGLADADGNTSYTGDVTKGLYVWGAQLEVGDFPTSYIKTTTASVTRNADVAEMTSTNFSDWFNQTEGSMFFQAQVRTPVTVGGWQINDSPVSGINHRLYNLFVSVGDITRFTVTNAGSNVVSIYSPSPSGEAVVDGQTYKASFAYKTDDYAVSLDGEAVTTDTSGTNPASFNRLNLAANYVSGNPIVGGAICIGKFYYWPTRKTDSFLQNITS